MTSTLDTAKVSRRKLRFATVDELLAEVDRIVQADHAGTIRRLGNWTPGQIMGHIAAWVNYGFEGYPTRRPPWFIRFILRRMGKKYLRDGMPAGRRIPGVENGTTGIEPLTTADGAQRLRAAFKRLESGEPLTYDSPAV